MTEPQTLKGPEKAAVFLLGLDESIACDVLRHLDPSDLQRLADIMPTLGTIPLTAFETTVEEFEDKLRGPVLPASPHSYMRQLMSSALGEDRARHVFEPPEKRSEAIEALRLAPASALAEALGQEHPQIAAAIVSRLEREHAAEVLEQLEDDIQLDLLQRLVGLEDIPQRPLQIATESVVASLANAPDKASGSGFDGIALVAGILNSLNSEASERILEEFAEQDADLANRVRETMFKFEDLARLDARAMQTLMREVSTEVLVLALKTAPDSLRDTFLAAVSSRAATQIREDLEIMPPRRVSEVEEAQREILNSAAQLAAENRIVLPGAGGEDLV
jgi:flagellar motor switch protein FliG